MFRSSGITRGGRGGIRSIQKRRSLASKSPVDGEPIGWHYRASADECEGGEVYVEDIPEGMSEPRWDGEKPRFRTDEEIAEDARQTTLQRVAAQAEESMAGIFVNPNDVLGLVAAVLYKTQAGEALTPEEQQAMAYLNQQYEHGLAKKAEIASADPKDLEAIEWEAS
jgi:hypothetical protein